MVGLLWVHALLTLISNTFAVANAISAAICEVVPNQKGFR